MALAKTKETPAADTKLDISRIFKAPRSKVWEAWTDPAAIAQWWGPQGMTPIVEKFEAKVGKVYRTGMRAANGDTFWVSGSFKEVVREQRLVFSWAWDHGDRHVTTVTVSFADVPGGTKVRLVHELFLTKEDRDNHKTGWTSSLECLKNALQGRGKAAA
jgi:uncharacterized protein YndB with AHSA1/START domain